jgi:hypothetical protein
MPVSFARIRKGAAYSRNTLSDLWDYSSFHAIARGVVTPRQDNKIILFVTEEKQLSAEQYKDKLSGDILEWEGPNDHFAEGRMAKAKETGEEIHLFHRQRHHEDFVCLGRAEVITYRPRSRQPSYFAFRVY